MIGWWDVASNWPVWNVVCDRSAWQVRMDVKTCKYFLSFAILVAWKLYSDGRRDTSYNLSMVRFYHLNYAFCFTVCRSSCIDNFEELCYFHCRSNGSRGIFSRCTVSDYPPFRLAPPLVATDRFQITRGNLKPISNYPLRVKVTSSKHALILVVLRWRQLS